MGNGFVFAFGSLAYFYRGAIRVRPTLFALAAAAYLAHTFVIPALEQSDVDKANLTASVLPFSLILLYLVQHPMRGARATAVANFLGKIAYPMFLLHWAVCVVMSAWLFHGLASFDMPGLWQGAGYFLVMFGGVIIVSLLFYVLIDQPVERYRRVVRRRAAVGVAVPA
jgi:peptidoglycan/LPS O-acetylase OafA/YrhL